MYPYNSPAEVRMWYEERLATAANRRCAAAVAQRASRTRGWRKRVMWLMVRRPNGVRRQLETVANN
jgi:hypothetical protein